MTKREGSAAWCVRILGEANYGKDHADRQTFYGFRLHAQLSWPGLLTRIFLAPANEADGEIAPIELPGTNGVVLGDRNYWLPDLQAYLRTIGIFGASLPSAKRTRLKRQRTFAVSWDGFATSSIRSSVN